VATYALATPHGTLLGRFELDDDEAEPGAIIARPGEPDRRVVGLLDYEPREGALPALVVGRV
jgi:hypothetical protein